MRRHSQPSTSHTSVDSVVPREFYEIWVHAEAQFDVYKYLQVNRKVSEAKLEGVCVKACAAREACGYDPGTPSGDDVEMMMQTSSPPILGITRSMPRGITRHRAIYLFCFVLLFL